MAKEIFSTRHGDVSVEQRNGGCRMAVSGPSREPGGRKLWPVSVEVTRTDAVQFYVLTVYIAGESGPAVYGKLGEIRKKLKVATQKRWGTRVADAAIEMLGGLK